MDRRTLHDLGGSHGAFRTDTEDHRRLHRGEEQKEPSGNFFGDRTSTHNARRAGTTTTTTTNRVNNNNISEATTSGPSSSSRYPPGMMEEIARNESFDDGQIVSPESLHAGLTSSWDEPSDGDEKSDSEDQSRAISRRDRRKFTDATTPTLIDEEDFEGEEEKEMVSLERDRLRETQRHFFPQDESSLRRTPGASMYRSNFEQAGIRRTPGASQMHKSPSPAVMQQEPPQSDSSVLGFGLTLSTPVGAASGKSAAAAAAAPKRPKVAWVGNAADASSSPSSSSPSADSAPRKDEVNNNASAVDRPPLAPGSMGREQKGAFYPPWALPRNVQSDATRGVISPNTLRLSEDIGNLLFEDDDTTEASRPQGAAATSSGEVYHPRDIGANSSSQPTLPSMSPSPYSESTENWTSSYVFDGETSHVPSRSTRSSGGGSRSRRNKTDGGRRNRGHERSSSYRTSDDRRPSRTGGFLPHMQQPKPQRKSQNLSSYGGTNEFTFDGSSNQTVNAFDTEDDSGAPGLLNFGAAFAPSSGGYVGDFRRPVPSMAGPDLNAMGVFTVSHSNTTQPLMPTSNFTFGSGPGFHHHSFQPLLSQQQGGGGPAPPPPQQQHSGFQPRFTVPEAVYPNNPMVSASPTFGFRPTMASYHIHPSNSHVPQDFPPAAAAAPPNMQMHPLQGPSAPHFSSQVWAQPVPMHFGGSLDPGNWHDSVGGWGASPGGYGGYNVSVSGEGGTSTIPLTTTWPETEPIPPEQTANPFAAPAPPQSTSSTKPSLSSPPPPPPPAQPQPQPTLSQKPSGSEGRIRNSNSGKNSRRGASRKGTRNQTKGDKGTKAEMSSQTFMGKKSGLSNTKAKKKQAKGRVSPTSHNNNNNSTQLSATNEVTAAADTTTDTTVDLKRAELTQSPTTRSAYKDFCKKLRAEERSSFQDAEAYAMQVLADGSLPETEHWRVYLELADLAKRANRFVEARALYQRVSRIQPYASQVWLEYSKLEEECGHMNRCATILRKGLGFCEYSENLLIRAIKHEEKMGNLGRARELLARLKHAAIGEVWKIVLEGAMLEARAGNDAMARRVLKYLLHHVPWYGPLYLEAYRLERDLGRSTEALVVVERGLSSIPRYGPLWFGAFRLCEVMDHNEGSYHLPRTMAMIERATSSISKELIWKVHLEAAQMLERSAVEHLDDSTTPTIQDLMATCRKRFAVTILTCPPNLRWKVWLAAGRMEIAAGEARLARGLFLRAHQVVPEKGRAVALLECARLEEFVGDSELASAVLCKSRVVSGSEWKVWLESVLLEIRKGDHNRATELAQEALKIHSGTGRLWASLVYLRHFGGGEQAQFTALKLALNAVPKSGEVWCEGARIHLNPFSHTFDTGRARRHLFFATKFTPQYGDGFLETLRLEIIEQWLLPLSRTIWESTNHLLQPSPSLLSSLIDANDDEAFASYIFTIFQIIYRVCRNYQDGDDGESNNNDKTVFSIMDNEAISRVRQQLQAEVLEKVVNINALELRCANADPNYGSLWFHCRVGPTDTARKVLYRALDRMRSEIFDNAHMYVVAYIRRFAVLKCVGDEHGGNTLGKIPVEPDWGSQDSEGSADWEEQIDQKLLAVPSLQRILDVGSKLHNNMEGSDIMKSTMNGPDFVTGLIELSRHTPMESMTLPERRKALFGTDALF